LGKDLSNLIIKLLLPCMIFSKMAGSFRTEAYPLWWIAPIAGLVMSLSGIAIAALLFRKQLPDNKNLLPLAGMQNSGFLVLSVGAVLFADNFTPFANQVFLFLIGIDLVLWSLGKYLVTSGSGRRFRIRDSLTPPLITILICMILVFSGVADLIPDTLISATGFLGNATIPLSMVVLGISLANVSMTQWPPLTESLKILSVKFLLIPIATFAVILATGIWRTDPTLARLLVIQSSSPPAISIMIQISHYGGDQQKIGSLMIIAYASALLLMPAWLAVGTLILS
jgi:predicted permease